MSGSALAALPEGFAVCDIAVPLRPHRSSAIEVLATARLVTKSDETLMAMSSHVRDRQFHPRTGRYQVPGLCQFQFEPPEIETSQHARLRTVDCDLCVDTTFSGSSPAGTREL
jgi:hypothetical protein